MRRDEFVPKGNGKGNLEEEEEELHYLATSTPGEDPRPYGE